MLKRGMILLVSSRFDPLSWLIMLGTKSKWTHTILIIDRKWCLESVGTGVKKSPLTKYFGKLGRIKYDYKLLQFKKINKKKLNNAIHYGLRLRKRRKYSLFIKSLFAIGLRLRKPSSQMSCSGFVSYCFSKVNIYLNKSKDPLDVTPADVANSKLLIDITSKLKNLVKPK